MKFLIPLILSSVLVAPALAYAHDPADVKLAARRHPLVGRQRGGGGRDRATAAAAAAATTAAAAGGAGGGGGGGGGQGAGAADAAAASSSADAAAVETASAAVATNRRQQAGGGGRGAAAAAAAAAASSSDAAAAAAATAAAAGGGGNAAANNGGGGGGGGGGNNAADLTLNPSIIVNTQANPNATAGQAASEVSDNNFINFCVGKTISNGAQVAGGACNPITMGDMPASSLQPTVRFTNPTNQATIPANQDFTISAISQNIQLGTFTNAQKNYFSAPQQLNGQGQIIGHMHVVVEQVQSATDASLLDPTKFVFFKGINAAPQGGVSTADVTGGLAAGTYRLCSITSSSNHQPVLTPVAQKGSTEDCVIFTAA